MCTMYIPGACRGQKKVPDSLELELQTVVRYRVGSRNMDSLEDQKILLITEPSLQLRGSL